MLEIMIIKKVEEVIDMKLFTFIADFKGGTYISQYLASSLEEAICLWIGNVGFLTEKQLKSFKKHINDDDLDILVKLEGLNNVWRNCYGVLGTLLLLHIIETVKEKVSDKKLFTFTADYKGGTYISQYMANTLDEALLLWIDKVDFFTEKQFKSFKKEIDFGDIDLPIKLKDVNNVWCVCYTVLGRLLVLNIVETVKKQV